MQTFHDHKLWQDAYVAVMDMYETTGRSEHEVLSAMRRHSLAVLTTVADALSRQDRHQRLEKFHNAIGEVASIRSLLSVAWGQKTLSDDAFRKLEEAYEQIGKQLMAVR